jgi:hypothetical protein
MESQQHMDDRLWDYIDGTCSVEEKTFIEQLVASNREWREKYKELLEVHQVMSSSLELEEPSMRFAQNVMEQIGKFQIAPAAKTYINKRVIWSVGIFFILSIIGFLIYGVGMINWADTSGSSSFFDLSKVDMSKLDFSKFFNNTYTNIFLMVNVVLGLMLLDMYLGKKKRQLQEKHF